LSMRLPMRLLALRAAIGCAVAARAAERSFQGAALQASHVLISDLVVVDVDVDVVDDALREEAGKHVVGVAPPILGRSSTPRLGLHG